MKKHILLLIPFFCIHYLNAQMDRQYYENGNLKAIGEYQNENKIGEWKAYYQNGQLQNKGTYVPIDYFSKRCKKDLDEAVKYYKKEMKDTIDKGYLYVEYDLDGVSIKSTLNYVGMANGTGNVAKTYTDRPVFINQLYDGNGVFKKVNIYEYKDYEDFCLKYEPLLQKECKGQYKEIISGNELYTNEKMFDNNKTTEYIISADKQTADMHFIWMKIDRTERDGEWEYYHENGQLYQTHFWKNGKLMAVNSCFDNKGNLLNKGTIINGNGTVNNYTANGELMSTTRYADGLEIDDKIQNWVKETIELHQYQDNEGTTYKYSVSFEETNIIINEILVADVFLDTISTEYKIPLKALKEITFEEKDSKSVMTFVVKDNTSLIQETSSDGRYWVTTIDIFLNNSFDQNKLRPQMTQAFNSLMKL
ncbi:hypothetical protein [Putridiphycobacter roseus]|nr:hypothetical protein [Putridiphycobacter roseus]